MNLFIGTKMIEAKPMTREEYNIFRHGFFTPEGDEKPNDEGYKVKYDNNYISWSPKDVFDKAYKKLNIEIGLELETLEQDLITNDYTFIEHDKNTFKAPHNYIIRCVEGNILCGVHFQEGMVKEKGLNGIFMEDLIAICINRLENFQTSEFKCRENAVTITKLEESLMWLRKRTLNRQKRGVQGITIV